MTTGDASSRKGKPGSVGSVSSKTWRATPSGRRRMADCRLTRAAELSGCLRPKRPSGNDPTPAEPTRPLQVVEVVTVTRMVGVGAILGPVRPQGP